jgi:DNA-directed RNA polymerase alpha subunit
MMPIDNLLQKLAKPAQRALEDADIKTLEALAEMTETEDANLHGIGRNAMAVIQSVLTENGMPFKK